ncbi:MAG: hypothetical protein GY899_15800 [Verrucomicrobiaceae bacterium]|nr:hypothetical protein [Verrucomicrobiaceae bacterium]
MMKKFRFFALLLIPIAVQGVASGQGREGRRGGDENMPQVGSLIPEVSVVDAQGGSFPLREKLKGRHAVIVFGCLT